jgi:hypothetical protein
MPIQHVPLNPIFPAVSPQTLDGLLQTYPLAIRELANQLRVQARAINALIDAVEALTP